MKKSLITIIIICFSVIVNAQENQINNYLLRAYRNGEDIQARGNMLVASSMGSIAFQKGLGAIHSLSHPVGALYNTHHGLTNAVFVPYVLKVNKEVIENKLTSLSRYIGLPKQSFDGFMEWVLYLRESLKIPHTLKDLIREDINFRQMSKMALADPSTGGNPKKLSQNDLKEMYIKSISGELF